MVVESQHHHHQQQQHHAHLLLQHHQQQQQQPPHRGRYGGGVVRGGGGGEIVEVQGGHIVRSTGRKDRHSKVCTAKGPRDRRVRLSAHTAIQFYDVQDRLGYDRPSKAVDWLIKNAKAAIDELAELPPWHPIAATTAITDNATTPSSTNPSPPSNTHSAAGNAIGDSGKKLMLMAEPPATTAYNFGDTGFLPPSLDSDAIADTIKSFFPMGGATGSPSSPPPPVGYHHQSYPPDLLSRTSSHAQDLRLSLQSFQDPIFHHPNTTHQALFASTAAPMVFDAGSASWSEPNQRMVAWNVADSGNPGSGGGGGGGGYVFNMQASPPAMPLHPLLGQSHQLFLQRGPLQSSNSPSVRSWTDPIATANQQMHPAFQLSAPTVAFQPGSGSFSGFLIPARIQGEEEHDGMSHKPPSASSASHH